MKKHGIPPLEKARKPSAGSKLSCVETGLLDAAQLESVTLRQESGSTANPVSTQDSFGVNAVQKSDDIVPSLRGETTLASVPEEVTMDEDGKTLQRSNSDTSSADVLPNAPDTEANDDEIIIWFGSNAAKAFQCRGWYRSDNEWQRKSDVVSRRNEANVARCAEDPKYRTRLCNHWDTSAGTFCPMRKKNKCIFAHGPVELRVKEAKRNRWGKLVDNNGDCSNPNHSGGEDTYGAARSIESERKQEGKWKGKSPNGLKSKSLDASRKKATKDVS